MNWTNRISEFASGVVSLADPSILSNDDSPSRFIRSYGELGGGLPDPVCLFGRFANRAWVDSYRQTALHLMQSIAHADRSPAVVAESTEILVPIRIA